MTDMLARVTVAPQAAEQMHTNLRRWGFDSLHLHLTGQQYDVLVPRTAYEKRKAIGS